MWDIILRNGFSITFATIESLMIKYTWVGLKFCVFVKIKQNSSIIFIGKRTSELVMLEYYGVQMKSKVSLNK